jgi:hypothetical protein
MRYGTGPMRLRVLLAAMFCAWAASGGARAGNLEPPGPPAPTMKTLDQIAPVLTQMLDATNGDANGCNSSRFKCVWGNLAVLDNETGLLWQRTASSVLNGERTYDSARSCTTGGRGGWRLPSLHELATVASSLPPEAPFVLPPGGSHFWTLTSASSNPQRQWTAATPTGNTIFATATPRRDQLRHYWCVRSIEPLLEY